MSDNCSFITVGIDTPNLNVGGTPVKRETTFKIPMPMTCGEN